MKFLCLCPTYGKTPEVIANAIKCFLDQTYKEAHLLIYDDLGNYRNAELLNRDFDNITLVSSLQRCPGIVPKYERMLELAKAFGIDYDALALWDDDDIYLPEHLANHAKTLCFPVDWSYPINVYSTYGNQLRAEESGGRFWASLAITRKSFQRVGGFVQSSLATFDQQSLAKFNALLHRGIPDQEAGPTYVFRWQDTKTIHAQHFMGDAVNWYNHVTPGFTSPVTLEDVLPRYQSGVPEIVAKLCAINAKMAATQF